MSSTLKEPGFVFISYSHKNSALVKPIIEAMKAIGINVWFDDGIEAGSEWASTIQKQIRGCAVFIPFLSPEYENSTNCYTEINYATKLDKAVLSVKMQPTPLERGLSLLLSHRQIVDRTDQGKYPDDAAFLHALLSADILDCCKSPEIYLTEERISEHIMECAAKLSYVDEIMRKKNIDTGIIESASVIGSSSETDARWKEKNVNASVDSSLYSYLHFRCTLKEEYDIPTSKSVKVRILTQNGEVVLEKEALIEIPSKTKNVTLPIRINDHSLENGKYSANISIDLINAFYLEFTINSDHKKFYSSRQIQKETKKRVEYVHLFILSLIRLFVFSKIYTSLTEPFYNYKKTLTIFFLSLLAWIVISAIISGRTVKYLDFNPLFSFIIVYLFGFVYTIYLFVKTIQNSKTYSTDSKALKEFKDFKS